jgi:nitroreductase
MEIEYLLTATPSARKSLDLDAPVNLGDIRECLRIALQAANGSNAQSWRWLVVADPVLRTKIAELYRDAYLMRVGGQLVSDLMPAGTPESRIMSSTEWLDRGTWLEKGTGAAAGNPLLRTLLTTHRWRRVVSSGNAVRFDLPAGVELSAGPAHPGIRDLHHHLAPAA